MTQNTRHTLILALLLALLISIAPAGIAQDTEEAIDNATIVQNYIEAWNTGDTSALIPLLTDDHITQTAVFGDVIGEEALDALIANTRTAIPDYTFTVDDISDFDGQVYVQGTITGTHSGPLMLNRMLAIIPTDNAINVRAMLSATIVEGELTRVEWIDDTFTLMTQMGAAKFPADVLKERRNTEVIQTWVDTLGNNENPDEMQERMASLYRAQFDRYTPNNRMHQFPNGNDYGGFLYQQVQESFPEREFNVISITATGDYVTLLYEFTGMFMADIGSPNNDVVKATGEEYGWDGAFVFRLEDGLIAEEWWYWDNELFAKVDYGYAD